MKRIATIILSLLMTLSLASCSVKEDKPTEESKTKDSVASELGTTGDEEELEEVDNSTEVSASDVETAEELKNGESTVIGVADGRNGSIIVKLALNGDKIEKVTVLSHSETYLVGTEPIQSYPAKIVEYQSLNLDTMTGATISSAGMINAVRDALKKAGLNPADYRAELPKGEAPKDTEADIVVVGSGAPGLTAASTAATEGKSVILLEKLSILGGTSVFSIEGFGSSESAVQQAVGAKITNDLNYEALVNGTPKAKPEAIKIFTEENGKAVDWLRSIGGSLNVTGSAASVTSSREAGSMGHVIVSALINEAEKNKVDIRKNSKPSN